MNLGLAKILSIFSSTSISAGGFLAEADNLINVSESTAAVLEMFVNGFLTLLGNIIYYLCQFALTLIDFLQVIVYKFLGITTKIEEFTPYDPNNPLIKFLTNDTVIDVLRTAMIVAVVLVIIFTIFAIIMGEWNRAAHDSEYSIKMVWSRAFRSLLGMVIFPAAFMAVVILINALLSSFAAVVSNNANISLGGQVFTLCAYDANVYRNYANNNKRIPIYIDFYDPYADGTHTRYSTEELAAIYSAFTTEGTELYNQFVNEDFLSFADTVSFNSRNNTLTNNYDAYGQFEKFVCTAEQYQVMADFVDYAVANGITYYYKPMSDADIEWKYVDSAQYNSATGSLRLTYSDASNLDNNEDTDSYTVVYEASPYTISSPIQDALGTLSTVLSLNGTYYSMLDYLEGSINKVSWASDKVLLKFSENYTDTTRWTAVDQILLYEYYRYSYNNTLQDYTLADLEEGIYLDAYTLECQYYRDYTDSYETLVSYKVVILNGNYYLLKDATERVLNSQTGKYEDQTLYDDYGDPLYEISHVEDGKEDAEVLADLTAHNNGLTAEQQPVGVYIKVLDKWYSATYDEHGQKLGENLMKNYMPDVKGVEFPVKDKNGKVIDTLYGFPNANGFYYEVDRLKATHRVKQVDWANKLMGDLKAIYRDLNLEQLITTGEWLQAFNSEIEVVENEYVASFDTSMISPQGIVFSEIFLGVLQESDGSNLADYMFTSKYSKKEQRELVLALCGEYDYETVSTTIDYFVDTFNLLFTPLLEKIMVGEGQAFVVGEVTSVQLYTYKAYLCSLLLSSDCAGFFLDIARELVVMYQFQYDVLAAQPSDYNLALNIVKEYTYPEIYGNTSGKIKYSYDFERLNINFAKYLDVATDSEGKTDGVVNQTDLKLIYEDTNGNSQIDVSEITLERTPLALLKEINALIDEVYLPFADIVIKENAKSSVYYGVNLAEKGVNLTNYGFKANTNYGKVGHEDEDKYIIDEANVNSYKQLSKYSELCSVIYNAINNEFTKTSTDCLVVKVYNNVKENLADQKVDEDSSAWPKYMTLYKQYLTGSLEQSEMLFSELVSKQDVSGRINEYDAYVRRYNKAITKLEDMELLTHFNISAGLFQSKEDKREDSLKDFGIYDVENKSETTLINKYYSDSATEDQRLLTMAELMQYSGISSGTFAIETTIKGYLKQKQVEKQIELIVKYAIDNGLIADVLKDGKLQDYTTPYDPDNPLAERELADAPENKIIAQKYIAYLQEYAYAVRDAVTNQMTLNEYHKYYITHAVRMSSTENVSKTFNVVINNHGYLMGLTMPTAKLTEYLIGGVYLGHLGFETAYVDQDYTGFFDVDYAEDGTIEFPKGNKANFNSVNTFINGLAEITMQSYYMSNLQNITKSNLENTPLNQLFYSGNYKDYTNTNLNKPYVKLILKHILENEYLERDVIKANMVFYEDFTYPNYFYTDAIAYVENEMTFDESCDSFNGTISYLTGSNKDYASMSAKQLRLELLDALVDYQNNSSSSSSENKNRYVTLFYMLCSDFVEIDTGTIDNNNNPIRQVYFTRDTTTQSLILKLAGLEDMPAELLVGLEYESLYSQNKGIDENNGDYFVICTFDEETQMYIPFLMNSGRSEQAYITTKDIINGEEKDTTWLEKYGYGIATTSYYTSAATEKVDQAFPVIAKGVITAEGMPTAIRQVDGVIEFYRNNLVIRNTSELNLNAYFMTTESLSINYNLFSALTNSIVQLFTGKTLVEHVYSKMPKFSIDSDIRLPLGVDNETIALTKSNVSVNYTFTELSGLSSQNFYTTIKINFLVLLIAIIALFPMLIKALYGVFGRIIDITVYYCMSPVMMSTISLGKNTSEGKEETPIYSEWMKTLSKKTISVFGYVVGFQIFFILIPFFSKLEFISDLTLFQELPLFRDISITFINRVINIVLIICSAYLITEAPKVFADILGQANGFAEGDTYKSNIKSTITEVKESLNGTKAVATINYAKESLREVTGLNTLSQATGTIKKAGAKVVSKGAEMYLRANGVPKETAKKLSGEMYANVKKQEDNKQALREERRLRAYDAYHQQLGINDTGDYHEQLQKIDDYLFKQGLKRRTKEQHKAIQAQYKDIVKKEKKKKAKKK